MNVLLIGAGGREHTLAWKLKQSPSVEKIYLAPGSDAMADLGEAIDINADDYKALAKWARANEIGLTVVGPEAPLAAGIADVFAREKLKVFGPVLAGAKLEGSKDFSKLFMKRHGVATADYRTFTQSGPALEYLKSLTPPYVLKADGLAAGKGVLICDGIEQAQSGLFDMMENLTFGDAGKRVVVEHHMSGEEVSMLCFCDGETILPMAAAQDHKRIGEGDTGLNTGGMGAYSPAPVLDEAMLKCVWDDVLTPTIDGMKADGMNFKGCLYVGLMITAAGPKVVEYNVRFGDPEAQVVVPRMDFDLAEVMLATAEGRLGELGPLKWKNQACAAVVMAAGGYPESYEKGKTISGLENVNGDDQVVFHAGTKKEDGIWKTAGGRVLAVSGLGNTFKEALAVAYAGVDKISFEGAQVRRDIGHRALARLP